MCNDYIYLFDTRAAACDRCLENNFLFPLFFLISFIPFTILLSSWVVAKYVYMPYMKQVENDEVFEEEEEEEEGEEETPYEDKYPISEANDDNKDKNMKNNSICESTPDGLVFMKYNKDNEGFDWWGDNKQTAYKYLETAARKYVKVFKCSSLYIDRKEDLKRQLEKEKQEEEKANMEAADKKEEVDSDDDLFVKFKPNEKIKPKKKEQRAAINGNKYKYCGKIKDFKVLKQIVKKKINKKMDFNAWKSMFN